MASYLNNKVIWLTGASSGIGEAVAYELAEKGARLILSARRKDELDRVKGNCPSASQANIRLLPLDVAEAATLPVIVEAALQLFGNIDILINNAGIGQSSLAKETGLETDRRIMEVDYFGAVALTKYLLPHFIQRGSGHVVVVSSVMGKMGTPYRSAYAAAKHALHGFFDSLRAELWADNKNLYVTMICPGWVRTNIGLHALTGSGEPLNRPLQKGLRPDDLAKKMVHAIEKKKEEVFIGGPKERFAVNLKQFWPGMFSKMTRRTS